jgi:HNH endonuclease
MPFTEALKTGVRTRADMRCCLCHSLGVEVHHIVPEADGGDSTDANAAPLCPSCHETYGANSTKQRFVREARDAWYATVAHQRDYVPGLAILRQALGELPTRSDLAATRDAVLAYLAQALSSIGRPRAESLGDILAHLYAQDLTKHHVTEPDVAMAFHLCFEGNMEWKDYDEVKLQFLQTFGTETARRLCGYCLTRSQARPATATGITEDELSVIATEIYGSMVFLVHHYELPDAAEPLELGVDPDGQIRAWALGRRPAGR